MTLKKIIVVQVVENAQERQHGSVVDVELVLEELGAESGLLPKDGYGEVHRLAEAQWKRRWGVGQ
jgi:hypothetical protein